MKEKDLYASILQWLQSNTFTIVGEKNIIDYRFVDCHSRYLNSYIRDERLEKILGPESVGWQIKVDLFGFIKTSKKSFKYVIEVKNTQASLTDLSQLIGYTYICNPDDAYLISSKGFSPDLKNLFHVYERKDILRIYSTKNKRFFSKIKLLSWDINTNAPNYGDSIEF